MMNKEPAPQHQYKCLVKMIEILGEEESNKMLKEVWNAGELTPLAVYLDRLVFNQKRRKASILGEIDFVLDIIRILSKPLRKEFDHKKLRWRSKVLSQAFKVKSKYGKKEFVSEVDPKEAEFVEKYKIKNHELKEKKRAVPTCYRRPKEGGEFWEELEKEFEEYYANNA